jgi:hypothetical protein
LTHPAMALIDRRHFFLKLGLL